MGRTLKIAVARDQKAARKHEGKLVRRDVLVVGWGGGAPARFGRAQLIDASEPAKAHRLGGVAVVAGSSSPKILEALLGVPDPLVLVVLAKGRPSTELAVAVKRRNGCAIVMLDAFEAAAFLVGDGQILAREEEVWGKAPKAPAPAPTRQTKRRKRQKAPEVKTPEVEAPEPKTPSTSGDWETSR